MRQLTLSLAAMLLSVALSAASLASGAEVPSTRLEMQLSFAPVVEKAAPAVVNIYSRRVVEARTTSPLFADPFFRRFFGNAVPFGRPRAQVQNALGSGVLVDRHGVIVTNHHVVDGADEISVVLADGREYQATLIGSDERTDLAVLKIDEGDGALPFLQLRDSDEVAVGDLVLAIGNPFGVGQTVTSGIVSALARTHVGVSDMNFFIQTDAAINPGNSGGALVDMSGQLIGINTAIYSRSGGSLGIGFAVPSNMVRTVVAGLSAGGRLVRPWLGAWGRSVDGDLAEALGLDRPSGVLIEDVRAGGPADRSGLRQGDVIQSINGRPVQGSEVLAYRIATLGLGDDASIGVWRQGRQMVLRTQLKAPPEDPPREQTELRGRHPLAGATVANLSPAVADEMMLSDRLSGVVIVAVAPEGAAARLGLARGDRILKVNDARVSDVRDLKRVLGRSASGWRIQIGRDERAFTLVISG
jgi:serine protease Do